MAHTSQTSQRGSATLEITVLFPALLLLVCAIFQTGLWYYARNAALAAAEEGARAASVVDGTTADGTVAAAEFIDRAGGKLIQKVRTTARRSTTKATVTVSGRSLSIIPGMDGFQIRQSATLPVERLTDG